MSENDVNKKMAAGFYRNLELPQPRSEQSDLSKRLINLME